MKQVSIIAACVLAISIVASPADQKPEADDRGAILFEDSLTGDWEENWLLDGKKTIIQASDRGSFSCRAR